MRRNKYYLMGHKYRCDKCGFTYRGLASKICPNCRSTKVKAYNNMIRFGRRRSKDPLRRKRSREMNKIVNGNPRSNKMHW